MFMLIFVLNDCDKLEAVLDAWEGAGVQGVTVLSSTGIGRLRQFQGFRDDIPLMPGLDDLYSCEDNIHRTLFSVVKEEEQIDKVVEVTQKIVGDLSQPGTGLLAVLPLSRVYGLDKNSAE
jgi:nitrogen regulatory protein PII